MDILLADFRLLHVEKGMVNNFCQTRFFETADGKIVICYSPSWKNSKQSVKDLIANGEHEVSEEYVISKGIVLASPGQIESTYEKLTSKIVVYCTSAEKKAWQRAFGRRELSRKGRELFQLAKLETRQGEKALTGREAALLTSDLDSV